MARLSVAIVSGLLVLLTTACQSWAERNPHQGSHKPAVKAIYASAHCGRSQATSKATWINNVRQLEASIRQIRTGILGGKPANLPVLDFQHEIGLLVEMGQRPTLGYRVEMGEANNLHMSQGQARLTLNWVHPPANTLVAQAISSPCLLLKLERGDYASIQVLDVQGVVRASAP